MHFIVGLDLVERSGAAISFAGWLQAESRTAGTRNPHNLTGLHVLERASSTLAIQLGIHEEAELDQLALTAAQAAVGRTEGRVDFLDVSVQRAQAAETALADACLETRPDALIIGRARGAGISSLPRLGRVARRLLRALPVPIVVVPPGLFASDLPAGPVLVASDLTADSVSAVCDASRLARSLGRGVHVVHVATDFADLPPTYLPRTLVDGARKTYEDKLQAKLNAWISGTHAAVDSAAVEFGATVDRICGTARRLGAPLIVCGSRKLSLGQRVFHTSVGSTLAGLAHCPVLVVPTDEESESRGTVRGVPA